MGAKNQDDVQFQETRNMETMGRFGYRNSLAYTGISEERDFRTHRSTSQSSRFCSDKYLGGFAQIEQQIFLSFS